MLEFIPNTLQYGEEFSFSNMYLAMNSRHRKTIILPYIHGNQNATVVRESTVLLV